MSDTAIRRPGTRWHRYRPVFDEATPELPGVGATMCGIGMARMTQRVPLDQVPPEDWCRRCWPKEQR